MKWAKALGFLLLLFMLQGCIDYEETMTLNPNGSAAVKIHYYIDESLMAMAEESQGQLTFDKASLEKEFKQAGLKPLNTKVYTESGKRHVTFDLKFKDINKIPHKVPFERREISLIKISNRTYLYRSVMKTETPQDTKEAEVDTTDEFNTDEMIKTIKTLFVGHTFTFTLETPYKILETNAGGKIEGKKVTWEFPLAKIDEDNIVMTAKLSAPLLSAQMLIVLGSALLLLILGGLAALILVKRKNRGKQAPATADSP